MSPIQLWFLKAIATISSGKISAGHLNLTCPLFVAAYAELVQRGEKSNSQISPHFRVGSLLSHRFQLLWKTMAAILTRAPLTVNLDSITCAKMKLHRSRSLKTFPDKKTFSRPSLILDCFQNWPQL